MPTGVTVSGVQTANITSTGLIGGTASAGTAQVQTLTVNTAPAATTDTFTVSYGGNSIVTTAAATSQTAEATAIASAINTLAGATIAVASQVGSTSAYKVVVTAPTAGTPLPTISVAFGTAADAVNFSNVTTTANVVPGTNAQYDVSGWTGLTNFNGTSVGGENVKAAATTSISATDSALGAGAITTVGGNNVTINALGQTTGTITVGSSTASQQPAGAVSITSTAGTNGATVSAGAINVTGGSSVSVTQGVASGVTNGSTLNQSGIVVTGNAATASVTVNQANYAAGNAAQTATNGVLTATAVTGAPGVQAVTGATSVTYVATTKAAAPAVNQGAVTIADKNGDSQTTASSISTVTLNGWANGSSIKSSALSTLNLSGTTAGGTNGLTITDNLTAHATARTTLALNTTSLAANATGTSSAGVVTYNNTLSTVNLTNSGLTNFGLAANKLATLNVAGTGSVVLPVNTTDLGTALTSLAVSGAVSFNDGSIVSSTGLLAANGGLNTYGSALTISNTSSGNFTATLNATKQAYTGGTGNDTIVILADATQSIVGGAGTDELILGTAGSNFTAAYSGRNVTGFETLGIVDVNGSSTVDVAQLFGNNFSNINVRSVLNNNTVTISNVAQNAGINFLTSNGTTAYAGSVVVNYIDKTGASDNVTVTLGSATNSANFTVNSLTVQDANGVGIGTLNIVSNNTLQAYGSAGNATDGLNTITTLVDNSLSTLNVSGSGALTITNGLNSSSDALSISNTGTNSLGLTLGVISGANSGNTLDTLTFTGSNKTVVTSLYATAADLTITNSGTSTVQVAGITSDGTNTAELTSLTLNGNVRIGAANGSSPATQVSLGSSAGITINGSTDNSQVAVSLAAAGSTVGNVTTLGNGNNYVTDATYAGDITITVGSGSNLIKVGGTGVSDAVVGDVLVTLGADDPNVNTDYVYVGAVGDVAATFTRANVVVAGANTGDRIYFAADSSSATSFTSSTQGTTLATVLANLVDAVDASNHLVAYQTFAGNTYVAQNVTGGTNEITIVEITGVHTLTAAAGYVQLAS